MPTSFSYIPEVEQISVDASGYTRTAVLCCLWRLPLDERDTRIIRQYNETLNETTFTVVGLPAGSRPQKLWQNGVEVFAPKMAFEQDGVVAIITIKTQAFFNLNWEFEIISPA